METANDGIPGQYRELPGVKEPKMEFSVFRKPSRMKEEKPLNDRSIFSPNHPKCIENAGYHFQSFAENASIDGIKFVGEKGRTIPERVFWIVILLITLVLCVFLVVQTFKKWINSPVIVTFATSQTPIFEIPFPAITICSEVKASRKFFNYTDVFLKKSNNKTIDESEEHGFNYMVLICDATEEVIDENAKFTNSAAVDYFMSVAPDFDLTTLSIEWKGKEFEAKESKLFSPTLTSEGVCYTFNALDRKELFTDLVSYQEELFSIADKSQWSLETGYSKNADLEAYPKRTVTAGAKGGLTLILGVFDHNLDYACGDSLQGFKVTLHHPAELPSPKQNYFRIPLQQTVVATVKPNMITTSESLRPYSPTDRQCYFVSEKKLKFFRNYNQQNCLIECLANFTLKACGCVSFHMPREEPTPVCGAANMECMEDANVLFLANEVNYKIKQSRKSKRTRRGLNLEELGYEERCDCLPSCTSLGYDVEISQSEWNWREMFNIMRQTRNWNKAIDQFLENNSFHIARMTISFKEMQFITLQRNELYGATDFWANVGGIVGLFTGFSFITIFEILYYLTLRLGCNIRMFGRRYWSGAEELLEEAGTVSSRNKNT